MKESKNKPVQVVLTYTTGNSAAKVINANAVSGEQQNKENSHFKLDENNKLVRRYSFDDNGGGYLGL